LTQISEQLEDLRIRRTRKMLQQAMIDLTIEIGFPAITVRDITERAMCNRSTFYRHYLDKFDLLNRYLDEVLALTRKGDEEMEKNPNEHELPLGLMLLLDHIQENAAFYCVMFGEKGDAAFTQRFRENAAERFRYLIARLDIQYDPAGPPRELRINYVAYAGIGVIAWWLNSGMPCSTEQLARWIGQLSSVTSGLVPRART
jgi:AcrR family transcriptional regulator